MFYLIYNFHKEIKQYIAIYIHKLTKLNIIFIKPFYIFISKKLVNINISKLNFNIIIQGSILTFSNYCS